MKCFQHTLKISTQKICATDEFFKNRGRETLERVKQVIHAKEKTHIFD